MSLRFLANALAASFIASAADSTLPNTDIASDFCSSVRSFALMISFFAASMMPLYAGASVVTASSALAFAAASSSALVFSAVVQYSVFQVVYSWFALS